jgi:hypothetical protein
MLQSRILQVILGLSLALALAVLATHPRIRKWEQRLGVTILLATGLPFLALGAIFRLDSIDILTDAVLEDLRPAFEFGLGWVGFVVGLRFDIRRIDKLPKSIGPAIVAQSLSPMIVVGIGSGFLLYGLGLRPGEGLYVHTLILAACAAASAPVNAVALTFAYGTKASSLVGEITALDEVAALSLLALISILKRPDAAFTAWTLPASAWFLLLLGLGVLLGVLVYLLLRGAKNEAEEICFLIGGVALSAGVAGYLALSIPVTCALAGAMLANLPLRDRAGLDSLLNSVERPLYLIFLLIVGASWSPWDWQGWALGLVFVFTRLLGKFIGSFWAKRVGPEALPSTYPLALSLLPQSPIAIVVIVSASPLLDTDHTLFQRTIHAVIIGGILSEVIAKLLPKPTIKIAPVVVLPLLALNKEVLAPEIQNGEEVI